MTKNNSGAVTINHITIKLEHTTVTFGRWNHRNNVLFLVMCVFLDVRASSPDVWQDSVYTQHSQMCPDRHVFPQTPMPIKAFVV